jgi:hypothetical protein
MRSLSRRCAPLLAVLLLGGCGGATELEEAAPAATARELFALAATDTRQDDRLHELFDLRLVDGDRAGLLDALDELGSVSPAADVAITPLSGPSEVVVDLTAELPGGGSASYSVQLREDTDASWRITWFLGPGVEWPASSRKGEGLTVSPDPE